MDVEWSKIHFLNLLSIGWKKKLIYLFYNRRMKFIIIYYITISSRYLNLFFFLNKYFIHVPNNYNMNNALYYIRHIDCVWPLKV